MYFTAKMFSNHNLKMIDESEMEWVTNKWNQSKIDNQAFDFKESNHSCHKVFLNKNAQLFDSQSTDTFSQEPRFTNTRHVWYFCHASIPTALSKHVLSTGHTPKFVKTIKIAEWKCMTK